MKSRWITVALCAVALAILIVRLLPLTHHEPHSSAPRQGHTANPYAGLRALVFESSRDNFGLGPGSISTEPFAVVTDWGDPQGTTTIVAVADGSASVYPGTGAASIGGGQAHPSIHEAALKTVQLAATVQPLMHPTSSYPLASPGQVTFYVVTDAGVFTSTATQDDLQSNRSPFSALATAAQNIAGEYRRVQSR